MGRAAKALLWSLVFVGAAGIGAFIAAHSNPFPPSVEGGPSSVPVITLTSTSPTPQPAIWKGRLTSTTYHQLYVGGRCTTDWSGTIVVSIDDAGSVKGAARLRRVGKLRCDFPTAQAQVASFSLGVTGSVTSDGLDLHLKAVSRTPVSGADEYGGFLHTVLEPGGRSTIVVADAGHGAAQGVLSMHRLDREGRGTYVSRTRVRLGCVRRCPA